MLDFIDFAYVSIFLLKLQVWSQKGFGRVACSRVLGAGSHATIFNPF